MKTPLVLAAALMVSGCVVAPHAGYYRHGYYDSGGYAPRYAHVPRYAPAPYYSGYGPRW